MREILSQIYQVGQSLWYDNIERKLLQDGFLAGMIERGEKNITLKNIKKIANALKLDLRDLFNF